MLENELRLKRKDGKYRWHLCRVNPILDKRGNTIVWFGSITDIDEWHKATTKQQRLMQITKALKQQRKELVALNDSKDEFISVASHQLRTPATAVKQYIGMMLEGYVGELNPEQLAALQTAYESNERQLDTVNDLLRVAQADAGKVVLHKEDCNLVELLQGVIDEQRDKFSQKKQRIIYHHDSKNAVCNIDKARMRMVFENLIDNANKYTFEGKRVTVTCADAPTQVIITVTDEGVGIDEKSVPKLFQKFSRIENPLSTQAGGTGLGLYWAYKIVLLHDGELEVQSIPKIGTTFTVKLPKQKTKNQQR
jgi:signal transduction histidine kinase